MGESAAILGETNRAQAGQIEEATNARTRIITDPELVTAETKRLIVSSHEYCIAASSHELLFAEANLTPELEAVFKRVRAGEHKGLRWVTRIDSKSLHAAKKFMEMGMSLRHVARDPLENFGFSENEVGVSFSRTGKDGHVSISTLISTDPLYLDHYRRIFGELWNSGIDASLRIREIEEGIEPPTIQIISDPTQIKNKYHELVSSARESALLLLPTTAAFRREVNFGIIEELCRAADARGARVQILCPMEPRIEESLVSLPIRFREIRPPVNQTATRVTIVIVDRKESLIVELKDDSKSEFTDAVGLATYSNSRSTVDSYIAFFEKLWRESELREREERSRKQAELLQDILTHDIRNYGQVSLLSAELLKEHLEDDEVARPLLRNLITSLQGASDLLERARKLGKVVSELEPKLFAVDARTAMESALKLVRDGFPEKEINFALEGPREVSVVADDLLYEVFLNLFSNSVRYTDQDKVAIESSIEEVKGQSGRSYWKITVSDRGRGIKDKQDVFSRYYKGAKGSGLGMSIVQALVAERYSGKVELKDRIEGDYTQGLRAELYLREAGE
jgi:two-component system, OmpR family, sensor histidine kinase VicK